VRAVVVGNDDGGRPARRLHRLARERESVADNYTRWCVASGSERALRFAAYTAALDQEHKTAAAYEQAVTDLARGLMLAAVDSHDQFSTSIQPARTATEG
jgi:hypothetical protein